MYTYAYQAISEIPDMTLCLNETFISKATTLMIIAGILAFAMVLFAAIAEKRARPYGIIVAIAQPVGLYAALQYVLQYAKMDFTCLQITVNSSVSLADAEAKLYDQLAEVFVEEMLGHYIMMLLWGVVLLVVFVLTLIYICTQFKTKGKGLAVGALVILIVKQVLVCPVEMVSLLLGQGSASIQSIWNVFFTGCYLLPLLLLCVQGILKLAGKKTVVEAENAPAEE